MSVTQEFEVENGLVGMMRCVNLRLIEIVGEQEIRRGMLDYWIYTRMESLFEVLDEEDALREKMRVTKMFMTERIKSLLARRECGLRYYDEIKSILCMCAETMDYKDHYYFATIMDNLDHFGIEKPQ
jgi:hypothetical protein